MPISVRFCIRKGYDTLQVRITIDGKEGSPFSTLHDGRTLSVGGTWDQKKQKRTDREGNEFNRRLRAIVTDCENICESQRNAGFAPTPKTVQLHYQTGQAPADPTSPEPPKPVDTLLEAYRSQIIILMGFKGTENEQAASTIEKWQYGLTYLEEYLRAKGQINLRVEYVGIGWAKEYHTYLMKTGPMSADSATRYVKRLSVAIDTHNDHLPPAERNRVYNPLSGYQFGRAKTKEVYFLEKPHLQKFWQLDNRGTAGVCLWWMGLIFLTGLDYPDAVRYIQHRDKYDRAGTVRPGIEIRRSKPPKAMCKIPVWPELTALLQHTPKGEPPTANEINEYMKGVEVLINFPHRLTCKIGRKTAGYIFLLRGYTIQAVSRILGHSSIEITERYYVKVTTELVDQEDAKLTNNLIF